MIAGSNVCVIGGAGFLGSHLVDYLLSLDCKVLVLDNLLNGRTKYVNKPAKFLWFDIRGDEMELASILTKYGIEYVFNYAAEPYVPGSYERPKHFFDINAVSVLNVLNACGYAGIKKVLQVSSAEIYGNSKGKIKEDATIEPHSTYGVSKVAADGLVQVRWKEAGIPAIAMRQFNCVGERETHEYVIPEIISQIHKSYAYKGQKGIKVWLGNNSFRDFLYAGDAVRMAVELLEKGQPGEVYNLGSEEGIQIYDLAHRIADAWGVEIEIITDEPRKRAWEIWHLQADNTKLYSVIERRPEVTLDEALRRTVEYFKQNGCKWDF